MSDWNDCAHDWREDPRDTDCGEGRTDMRCIKCNCPGERDDASGDIFWPAT